MKDRPLAEQLDDVGEDLRLQRSLLGDRATDLLRDLIIRGQLKPGSKLAERDVAELLGVSRAPARDALIRLEEEGLVVTKSRGRYVIELSERDILDLYQVRLALETLAVELAVRNMCPPHRANLEHLQESMRQAVARRDHAAYARSDVDSHLLIWRQAKNRQLYEVLHSMSGLIFMFVSQHAELYDWQDTLACHEELVRCMCACDAQAACDSIRRHLAQARARSLCMLRNKKDPATIPTDDSLRHTLQAVREVWSHPSDS